MASITNSLTTQPLHAPYRPAQRSYKAVLPPITQEQFDRYESLNTEDLVKRVSGITSLPNAISTHSVNHNTFSKFG